MRVRARVRVRVRARVRIRVRARVRVRNRVRVGVKQKGLALPDVSRWGLVNPRTRLDPDANVAQPRWVPA